ncbi:MAG: hypothetical protein Q4C67_08475, partial [Deinococcus sp.]|nr:hypothetical protein [Deinococcus sp.]
NAAFRLSFPGLSTGQARALAARLPGNLRYSDGAYLSRAAQDAGPRTPLLDIELDLPAAPELTLQLRTAPGMPPAADKAPDAGADTATGTNTPEGELRP